jgi:hypothetical protein
MGHIRVPSPRGRSCEMFYRVRRDILEACLRQHLRGLAEWAMAGSNFSFPHLCVWMFSTEATTESVTREILCSYLLCSKKRKRLQRKTYSCFSEPVHFLITAVACIYALCLLYAKNEIRRSRQGCIVRSRQNILYFY